MYSQNSINSLQAAGIDFPGLERDGIDPFEFAALLISSGLVCDEDVKWISFHGGYDFGYLTKCLICKPLPDDEADFSILMKKFFPSIFDVKYLMNSAVRDHAIGKLNSTDPNVGELLAKYQEKRSLETMIEILKVKRQGSAHTAGSDALVTGKVFFQMRDRIFNGDIPSTHVGLVWGLGYPDNGQPHPHSTPQHYHRQLQENTTPSQNGYSNGSPSTPNTGHAGLASTPAHQNNGTGLAPLTPGGGGGAFGAFKFGQ
jgi:CCR4-NOT transcription complex subunit 7/8